MSDAEKCKSYKETQSSFNKLLETGVGIDKHLYVNQLVFLKTDLMAKNDTVRKAALEMLDFLLSLHIVDIQTETIKNLLDNNVNKFVQNCVLKSIKKKVKSTILEDRFNFTETLLPWKNHNVNKLTNIIEEVCLNDLPKDKCKEFFIYKVIPAMMELSTDNEIRDILTDMAFMLSTIVPISDLTEKELEVFLKAVNAKYVKNIGDLRDRDYPNWHNLWIFLVRFCDKNIHNSMELTNRLLRVVEYAFRNATIPQRLKGYDCWKELIDNASLDMKHMCSPKQIKLLVTPLKAKFSKQEIVICKRFDVFSYLLEKLQHKAVLCLTEFLEFCFGPIGDNNMDVTKVGQGKTVPQIWTKSTKVLVDIIGHSHGKSISCLTTEDVIKLEKPIINHTNISSHYRVVINSVGECCTLLKEVDIESKRETVIKCMWKSVFNLVIPTADSVRSKYFLAVSDVLDKYIKQSRENPYFEDLLVLIITVLLSYDKDFVHEVIQYNLKQLLTIIFTTDNFPADVVDTFKTVLSHAFSKMLMMENKLRVIKDVMISFMKLQPNVENICHINKIWLCVANELILDFTAQQIEDFIEFNSFFMWPAFHLHHLDESAKKQSVLYWMKLYRKISLDNEERKQIVMRELEKIFKNNPLLSSDVVSLLNVMSQFETKFTKEFVIKLMSVSSLILLLPNLKTEDEQKITALVMQYFEPSLECYKCEQNEDVIKNICMCIEHILCFHKGYKLLDTLATFIRNSSNDLRAKFSHCLSNLLSDLYNKETDVNGYNAKELHKVIQVFTTTSDNKSVNPPFIAPVGRSARIASLAKNSARTPPLKSKKTDSSPTALRLFGKDLETLASLHVKGSQLNNSSPIRSRRATNSPRSKEKNSHSVYDEKSSDFVPIDTEVKFQPEKLSKHQKEVLQKRREDIPALYQDLSQSTSQDMFNSSSSSRTIEKNEKENISDKKVIVEMIGHHFPKEESPKSPKLPFDIPLSHIEDITVPNKEINTDKDVLALEKVKTADPEETMYESPQHTDQKSHIEDCKPPDGVIGGSVKAEEIPASEYPLKVTEIMGLKFDGHDEKDKRRKMKIEAELQKLRMDIVGADEFFGVSRGRRTREKPKKLEEGIKSKSSVKEEQPRLSLSEGRPDTKVNKARRKTIGSVKDAQLKEKTQSDTPKISRRKSTKTKAIKEDQNESETSTIVPQETKVEINEESGNKVVQKKGEKRKRSSFDEESEDIIESSQESPMDVTPIFNSSKRKNSTRTSMEEEMEKSDEKTLVQQKTVTMEDFVSDGGEKDIQDCGLENGIVTEADNDNVENLVQGDIITETAVHEGVPVHFEEVGQEVEISDVVEEVVSINMPEEKFEETDETSMEVCAVQEEIVMTHITDHKLNVTELPVAINSTQDTTITEDTTQEITNIEDLSQNDSQDMGMNDTQTQSTATQDTQTQDVPTQSDCGASSEDYRLPVLYFDLPKKPELTDSERIMCRMDTMSICSDPNNQDFRSQVGHDQSAEEVEIKATELCEDDTKMEDVLASPAAHISNLPSSPITIETPNRTSELLNNTLDISPINSKSSSDSGDTLETSTSISRNFKAELEELDRIEKKKNVESPPEATVEHTDKGNKENDEVLGNKEDINQNEDLPNTVEDIINILEGNPMNRTEEKPCETVFGEDIEDLLPQFEVPQPMPQITNEVEEHPHTIESFSSQTSDTEEVPRQVEEILNQIEESQPRITVQHQMEGLAEQMEDIPSQIEVMKPLKENNMQERASKLLNMVNVSSPATHRMFLKKRSGGLSMSPSSGRIKRLMSGINQKQSMEDFGGEVKEEDILTFSREVPSPLAVPRSSILKRKLSDTSDEGISPCAKRKRVNFSDPCLTSKKVFIKDDFRDLISIEAKCLFPNTPGTPSKEQHPIHIQELPDLGGISERMTESDNVETQASLEITNPLILRKDKPIYPKLSDCEEDVMVIVKKVTSPMFVNALMNKLKSKDIKTIGDLASRSEAEVNRFPFKVPVVANVYRALDNYYKKNVHKGDQDCVENGEVGANGIEERGKHYTYYKGLRSEAVDIRTEFREIVERSKIEGVIEDLAKILMTSLEKRQLVNLVKSHYKLEPKDFLEQEHFKFVIKHITDTIGLSNVFEILTERMENSENESVYFDCMIKHSIDKRPLVDLLANRGLADIKEGLQEGISRNMFAKKEVLENCLLPLVENPSDITDYLNRISVVQLGEVIIGRLEFSNLRQFFCRIIEIHGGKNVVTALSDDLFKHCEIMDSFKRCIEVQSEERRKEVMVEMFKFIGDQLDLNTLLELHVGFLKRIPSMVTCSEEK